jgi:lipopolysaccharide biosynthesis glycosyltransferase
MTDKKNLLVTLADKNYVNQAKQLFSSVYWNAGWTGDYMLLAHEIPEKELKWFRDKGILIKKCKPLYNKIIGTDGHPGTVVTKFYLFAPEFKKWKNIVYLDADMIVKSSLDKLAKTKKFAAVPEIYMGRICALEGQFDHTELKIFHELKKEYNLNLPSFNAGVISFNTKIIHDNTPIELKKLLDKYNSVCHYGEQAILNLFFYKKWKKIPFVYNLCINYFSEYSPEKAIIFHFAGIKKEQKPWNSKNIFYNEWKNNLEKAELIDLTKIPNGKKTEIFNLYFYYLSLKIKPVLFHLANGTDRIIGKIGIFLKKYAPRFYRFIKNCIS